MLYFGLLISFFLEYVRPGAYLPIIDATKIGTIIPLIVFVGSIFHKDPVDNKKLFQHSNSRWLLFFLGLLVLSVLTADVTLYSFDKFKLVLGYLFWYFMIVKLVTDMNKLRWLFIVLVLSHILLIILNPQLILNPETRSYIRGAPFLGDGNDFSLSACILIPMCIFLIIDTKSKLARMVYVVSLLVLIIAIIGTQSRGASIALASVFLFIWWSGQKKVLGLFILGTIGVIIINYAPDVYFGRMSSIANYEQEGSAMGRIIAWKTAIRMAKENPVLGVGSGHFPVKLGTEFRPPEFGDSNLPWLTAHSIYFLILGELGLPGIIFLLAMLIGNYSRLKRLHQKIRDSNEESASNYGRLFLMLNASLIAYAIGGAFLSAAYYPHLYVIAAMIVAASYIYEMETSNIDDTQKQKRSENYNHPEDK